MEKRYAMQRCGVVIPIIRQNKMYEKKLLKKGHFIIKMSTHLKK